MNIIRLTRRVPALPEAIQKELNSAQLREWLAQPRIPILASRDPLTRRFVEAMLNGERVDFIYVGGSTPGANRSIDVSLVFRQEEHGRIYVAGFCHARSGNRIFCLDRTMIIRRRC